MLERSLSTVNRDGTFGVRSAAKGILLLLVFAVPMLCAQTSAKIFGTVNDQNGRPVPEREWRLPEAAGLKTAAKRQLTAEQDGSFTLSELLPDTYQISATCDTSNDASSIVEVGPGQTRNTQLELNTESASDVISLDTHGTSLDTSSAKLGIDASGTEIAALPVNGRTFAPLSLTAPLVSNMAGPDFADLRFAGQPLEQNRSGTDAWHGSLFEYLRNDKLQARNFFDGSSKTELRMNQYGGSVGGALRKTSSSCLEALSS